MVRHMKKPRAKDMPYWKLLSSRHGSMASNCQHRASSLRQHKRSQNVSHKAKRGSPLGVSYASVSSYFLRRLVPRTNRQATAKHCLHRTLLPDIVEATIRRPGGADTVVPRGGSRSAARVCRGGHPMSMPKWRYVSIAI